jgi:hypothetical protein
MTLHKLYTQTMQDQRSKYALQFFSFTLSTCLHTKWSLTFISIFIQNYAWFINCHDKMEKNNYDFVQWTRFWITQNVKSVKFHIFQHSIITTCSKHAFPQCWYFSLYKIIQQEDRWVLQEHDACNPSYCLFHRYISMKVS